jgi:hypothetical protein
MRLALDENFWNGTPRGERANVAAGEAKPSA